MDKIEEQLVKLLEKAITVAEKTGDFAIDIAPEILQEFYMWRLVSNVLLIVLGLVILVAAFKAHLLLSEKNEPEEGEYKRRWGRFFRVYYYDESPSFQFAIAIRIAGSIASIVLIASGVYWATFIAIAPKVYLIEYFIK